MYSQLEMFPTVIEADREKASTTNSVIEDRTAKDRALNRYLTRNQYVTKRAKDIECSVAPYKSGGSKVKEYWRVQWREDKPKNLHIPGGNTRSKLANYRAKKIKEMIARGANLGEVIAAVEDFRGIKPEE